MEALFHRWLRPTRRTERLLGAFVVLALVGWLSLAAGHVHPLGSGHAGAAHAGAEHSGAEHAPGEHRDAGDRSHACSLCVALDRAAAPADPVRIALLSGPEGTARPESDPPAPASIAAAHYRSRAPPHA